MSPSANELQANEIILEQSPLLHSHSHTNPLNLISFAPSLQPFVTYFPLPHNTRSIHLLDLHCSPLLLDHPCQTSLSFLCTAIVLSPFSWKSRPRVAHTTSTPSPQQNTQPTAPSSPLPNFTRFAFAAQQQAITNHWCLPRINICFILFINLTTQLIHPPFLRTSLHLWVQSQTVNSNTSFVSRWILPRNQTIRGADTRRPLIGFEVPTSTASCSSCRYYNRH